MAVNRSRPSHSSDVSGEDTEGRPDELFPYDIADSRANLERLLTQARSRVGLVPFVGAGLSVPVGLMTWRDFLSELARSTPVSSQVEALLDAGRYEAAAEQVLTARGSNQLQVKLQATYGRNIGADELSGPVTLLPGLFDGPVVTTNYDHVLEAAYLTQDKPFESVLFAGRVDAVRDAYMSDRRVLIKIHGDASDRSERVLTVSDYERHYGADEPLRGVLAFLLTRPLLFLGCSLQTDRTVDVIGAWAQAHAPVTYHFAILPRPVHDDDLYDRNRFLSEMSILPIWYPPGQHVAVSRLLQYLAARRTESHRGEAPYTRQPVRMVLSGDPGDEVGSGVADRGATMERSVAGLGQHEPRFLDRTAGPDEGSDESVPVSHGPVGARAPLPFLLAEQGRVFAGRDHELGRCLSMWQEVVAGSRRTMLLTGEPGIGKTRLAAELARLVHDEGGLVLAGRCDEDLGVPYQPFVEALRHYARHVAELRLGRYGGELARLLPDLDATVTGLPDRLRSDPETERYRLFDAVAAWIGDASRDIPMLLVLDDLHWATKPTVLLLRHVLRCGEPLRVLVVVTYRDTDVRRDHPLAEFLADARRDDGVERLHLRGLDEVAVARLLELAAGEPASGEGGDSLGRVLWAQTEGHPFFVREVIRHLSESGSIVPHEGRWVLERPLEDVSVPDGVRDVVDRRLARLPEKVRIALEVAAVVGLEFEAPLVQVAGELDEEAWLEALDESVHAQLVVEVPQTQRGRFVHALVRGALYDGLSAARRASLHRRVARAIEAVHPELDDHLPSLAHHWAHAPTTRADRARAVDFAVRAGDRALDQLAHDEAASYYGQALDLIDQSGVSTDDAPRTDVLISLGEAQRRAGNPVHRQTLLAASRLAGRRGDSTALVRAALANTRGMIFSRGGLVDVERVGVLEQATGLLGTADSAERARLLALLGLELVFAGPEGDRRFHLSDEALGIARRLGDKPTLAAVLTARYYTVYTPATLDERLAVTQELLDIARDLGDPVACCRAAWIRFRCLLEVGDIEAASMCADLGGSLAEDISQPTLRWVAAWNRAGWQLRTGRVDQAEAAVRAAFDIGRASGQPDAGVFHAVQMYFVRREQERLGELVTTLEEVAREFRGLPFLDLLLAHAYCEQGRDDEARAIFEPVADARFATQPFDVSWMVAMSASIAVAGHLHDTVAAVHLYELLSPYGAQIVVTQSVIGGAATHHLGLLASELARPEDAEAHFIDAEAAHIQLGVPTWLARTRIELARTLLALRRPGDVDRAHKLLRLAQTTAAELGSAPLHRAITSALLP